MKTHIYSIKTNSIVCNSHKGNGNSISVEEYNSWTESYDIPHICKKCMSNVKKKHIKN